MTALTVSSVSIRNVLGIKHLEFEAGKWNEITGANGKGKTSVLEAIQSVTEGGKDATLLMKGEEKGEIVLVLSDNTKIRKRIGVGEGVTVEKDGVRQAKPQEFINALHDTLSTNPVAFLTAKPKDRVDVLLESLPMTADVERIRTIVGNPKLEVHDAHALVQIEKAYKDLEADRRDTNRAVREREASINQLAETLPKEAPGAVTGNVSELEGKLRVLDEAMAATGAGIDATMTKIDADCAAAVEAKREEIAKLQGEIADLRTAAGERKARGEAIRATKTDAWRAERQPLVDQLGIIRGSGEALAVASRTRATMNEFREVADKLQEDSEAMTKAMTKLQEYKTELMADLPIAGLTITAEGLFREGVPFERLNEAQRVGIAFEIAAMRAGELKIACIDGLENLDKPTYEAFKARAAETDLQLFVTKVDPTAGDLTVTKA